VKWTRSLSVALALGMVLVAAGAGALGVTQFVGELRAPTTSAGGSPVAGLGVSSGPVISVSLSVTPDQIDEGQPVTVTTTASGGDPSPSYTYDYFGMPNGCSTDEAQMFTCTPSQTGSFTNIYVNVTDGAGNGTNSADSALTVNQDISVQLTVSPSQITSGQTITVQTNANYGSGSFTYSYNGLPSDCMSGQGQNMFSCNPNQGDYNITVTVTDSVGGSATSGNQYLQVSSSNNNNGNGNSGSGSGSNNSSNPFGSLLSGLGSVLSLLIIAGIIGFVTWILLIVGVWIIAVVLIRRLPKRGTAAAAMLAGQTTKCSSCSAVIPGDTKFCPECGASTTASNTAPKTP
jgi:large repetitive protein